MSEQQAAQEAVFVGSGEMPEDSVVVKGVDMATSRHVGDAFESYLTSGFQATNFGLACEEVSKMLAWRLSEDEMTLERLRKNATISDEEAAVTRTRIFLGVTSAQLLSGVREAVCFVCRHRMVHVIVTPGGGIDGDLIRTLAPEAVRVGGPGAKICNLSVDLEAARGAVMRFVEKVLEGVQQTTPSELIARLGRSLEEAAPEQHTKSALFWAAKTGIPIYCPSIVDGLVGEAVLAVNRRRRAAGEPRVVLDLVVDVKGMNEQATSARHTGMIILGGGLVKHHICNANLMRNGADHSVFVGTGQEFDGSDAGARPDEAVSWGKIRIDTKPIKVYAEASFVFPALVAKSFLPFYHANKSLYP
eukprot:TRINITY_DN39554_c0_g1_i1.p1 TRINITY_DN39554_c0_g1~~TRINITY_DN39554_c0_g1_i1.p1  ORF type:complete len:386 (+),score=146.42 TRINITY_DN39554_c0_g1_i1:79-1158(+)